MKTTQKTSKTGFLKEIKSGFESIGQDLVADSKAAISGMAADFGSQLFGGGTTTPAENNPFASQERPAQPFTKSEKKEPQRIRKQEVVFNFLERQERSRLGAEIKNLMKEVRHELQLLKEQSLSNELSKVMMNEMPSDAGIYHLRFLEFIIKVLRSVRKQISSGKMWLQATVDKRSAKKFRGKAKKHGTSFSMSKELTQANLPG